jgi:acid phosphatase
MFVRGFLGTNSDTLGTVITVNSTGSSEALGDSLSPSDLCPAFADGNGGTYATTWDSIYLPPITARLNTLLTGNLTFTDSDVSNFPYLCGFESQITGYLSPWCGVFTDEELKNYEYRQDLRYYYGTGPGTGLASTMMLPFLNNLVQLLAQGPGITGTYPNGSTFTLPDLIMAFANDGQLTEFSAAVGVFDNQTPLSGTAIPADWLYIASHFVSMRGTVALERLNCSVAGSTAPSTTSTSISTTASPTPSAEAANCNHDNCLRQFLKSSAVTPFCATYTTAVNTATTSLPSYISQCSGLPSRISSACSCVVTPSSTSASIPTVTPTSAATNQTYIRIRLNDAVYPVPTCQDGPGRSCLLSTYVNLIAEKYNATGNWHDNCNVTNPESPEVVKGASFFTDLSLSWLNFVTP